MAYLAGHDLGISECVGQERGALHAGEERKGELVGVSPAHLAKLGLLPVDEEAEELGGVAIASVDQTLLVPVAAESD
jgi:hypothetical protein